MATRTIARMFDSYADASSAVRELETAGFSHDDVSLIANRGDDAADDADTAATAGGDSSASGAGTGATIGTLVGGGAGLLAGLGALAIPGLGPIVAAGWLVAAVTGAGVGAAAGGLLGGLTGAGLSEEHAHVYAEGVRRGGNLVTVRADETRAVEAERILMRHNPVDVEARAGEYRAGGWTRYDEESMTTPTSGMGTAAGVGTTMAADQMGTRTRAHSASDAVLGTGGAGRDGTPGNPPGTMASRGMDDALGTNVSGARPENERGSTVTTSSTATTGRDVSPGNPPGTMASRGTDQAAGTNVSGAYPGNERRDGGGPTGTGAPDGTPGNPPGTAVSRGVDEVAGTNISGAHPENEDKTDRSTPGSALNSTLGTGDAARNRNRNPRR